MGRKKGDHFVSAEKLVLIVEGLKHGDTNAQDLFAKTFEEYIKRYILTKVNYTEADDLVNRTMLTVFQSIHSLEEPLSLVAFVREIAHSHIYHFYHDKEVERKRKAKSEKRARETARKEKESRIRHCSGIDLSNPRILKAVNNLPEEQKEAVLLRAKGYKVREVAGIQGVTEGTVKSRLNYARKKVL